LKEEVFKKNLVFAKIFSKKLMPKELLLELLQEQEVENSFGIIGKAGATGQAIFVKLPVVMRSTPSVITLFNPSRANAQVDNESINADHTASGAAGVRESSFIINTTGNAGGAVGDIMGVHWTADAEL